MLKMYLAFTTHYTINNNYEWATYEYLNSEFQIILTFCRYVSNNKLNVVHDKVQIPLKFKYFLWPFGQMATINKWQH